MSADTTDETQDARPGGAAKAGMALAVAWCADPSRVGEVLLLDDETRVFGRGEPAGDDPHPRVLLARQRPYDTKDAPPIALSGLSRVQLELRPAGAELWIKNLGKRPLLDGEGQARPEVSLALGDCVEVRGQIVFVRIERPRKLTPLRSLPAPAFAFGEADAHGLVGESPVAWTLRDQCAFVAPRDAHVLVLGESGSGKELVAQAIHAASKRGRRPMVARNAATIPAGIVDAELFGNVANYPNPGTPERRGLVGESDGSTLFLDEIGELAEDLQVRLLRVLDERGEYQRLGEARPRSSDLRLIGATNRPLAALKHDVAARFRLRLRVPGLEERREDVPLVARQLLQRIATNDADIRRRYFEGDDAARPRVSAALMRALVRHRYRTHCRELDAILWHSIATSPEDVLDLTAEVEEDLALAAPVAGSHRRPGEVTADEVRAALERAGGVQEKAWRDLGLANRYVLKRLIAKLGL